MFFLPIHIDRVTINQVAAAKAIIPGLEVSPIESRWDALNEAIRKAPESLPAGHTVSINHSLHILNKGELRDSSDRRDINFATWTEDGWFFELRVTKQ